MPRSVKDSDEDVESKIGRRTRAGVGTLVTDSPVRRSNRNKQSTKLTSSSPEELIIEINTQSTRAFRTRAGTADSNTLDSQKRLRSNKNSIDTDIIELPLETQPKKMTRRSLAATLAPDTPKTNTRPKRLTRAGSESKSTPSRTTRKTRASSMEPEPTVNASAEEMESKVINTPTKVKKRASILPSQSTLIEEEEEKIPVVELEKMLIEVDESSVEIITINETAPKKPISPKNNSVEKNKSIDKMKEERDSNSAEGLVDDSSESNRMEISEEFQNTANLLFDKINTPKKDEYPAADVNDVVLIKDVSTDSSRNSKDLSKEIISKDENILNVSIKEEKEMNSNNKENECFNVNNSMSEQNKSIFNPKNLYKETSTVVIDDTSIKEKKYVEVDVESNDSIKVDGSGLTESSISSLNCNNTVISNSNVNKDNVPNLEKEHKCISVSNTEETLFNEKEHETSSSNNEKENKSSIENLNDSNIVSYKMLVNEEDSKEQSKISDDNSRQIQDKTIIEEEQSLETITQNENNTETDSKNEIKDKANVSVNSKEILTDASAKEDNCSNVVSATEISNVENDEKKCDETAEVIPTCKNSPVTEHTNCSTNDNQDNMSNESTIESSLALEVSSDSIKDPSNDANSTKCSLKLQSSEFSNTVSEKIDSSPVTESHNIPEANLSDKEKEPKIKSSSNTPVTSNKKLVSESSILESKEKTKKDGVQSDDDSSDDVSNIKMLFQDISADKWKQKSKNINTENISIHSSTVKLETDSETECDLLLVDKKAWLAAEKLKAIKNIETFDYDSDDTIILKTELDYLNDKLNNKNKKEIKSKNTVQHSDTNSEIKESMEKSNSSSKQTSKEVQDELNEVEEYSNKSIDKTSIDKSNLNVSSHSMSKKEKSRSMSSSCNVSKSELSKSLIKQLEEEEEKEISLTQKICKNVEATATVNVNKLEINPSQSKLTRSSDKKQKKRHSLNRSLNSSFNSSINKTNEPKLKSKKYNRLINISSSEEEENDENNSKYNKNELTQLKIGSGKKRVNQNYSTMVHIGSDSSDSCNESIDSNNSNIRNKTPRIPRFLFEHKDDKETNEEDNESDDFSVEGKFSDISIDSDIKAEYNLDGNATRTFSDDDIPGDECRASESEFSDPDDNGSDLADFVVDDDEVEEENEEDEGDENEGVDEGEDEEVKDKEKDKNEKEDEDEDEDEEQEKEDKENEKENTKLTENMSCEEENNEIDNETKDKGSLNKSINISDVKNEEKKSPKQKISTQLHLSELDEDKIVSDNILELDSSSTAGKKQKQKLSENSEASQETQNDMTYKRKNEEPNISLSCSTPKLNILSKHKLKHNTSKEENDRKSTNKVLTNEKQENIHTKDLSVDNSEANTSALNDSKTTKKKCSIKNSSFVNFIELFKDQTLPKMLLSKKGHLNKSVSPRSETPNTKFLKKEKLNDSFPNIKLGEKKNVFKSGDINDHQKNATEENENARIITAEVTEQLESNSSVLTKRKRSAETIDINDQTELKNKKNKISTKLEKYTESDNENENLESELKNDDKKKTTKRKKNKKNKNSKKELETENIDTTPTVKKNMDKGEEIEVVCSSNERKNKNKKKKNKYKENIEIKDKNNEKLMSIAEDDKIYAEIKNIPNKKKMKINSELPTLQVKEKSKRLLQKTTIKSSNTQESFERPSTTQFIESKYEALEAAKLAIEKIKADRNKNQNNQKDRFQRIQRQEKENKVKKPDQIMAKNFTRGIKRLPADVIENLSDVPMNPFKKQKLINKPTQQTTLHTFMTKSGFTEGYVTKARKVPSNSGGTTEFNIINLQKAKKQLKNISPNAVFLRNKLLNRNPRYPTTSYIMYLQKQKAFNKDQWFTKQQ